MRPIGLIALFLLAGCVSPQQACIANAQKDIRILNSLINEAQTNIDRGYAVRTEEFFENEQQQCGVVNGEIVYCDVAVADTRHVPYAIDLNAEAAKLNSLIAKRQDLGKRSAAVVAECKIRYPEA